MFKKPLALLCCIVFFLLLAACSGGNLPNGPAKISWQQPVAPHPQTLVPTEGGIFVGYGCPVKTREYSGFTYTAAGQGVVTSIPGSYNGWVTCPGSAAVAYDQTIYTVAYAGRQAGVVAYGKVRWVLPLQVRSVAGLCLMGGNLYALLIAQTSKNQIVSVAKIGTDGVVRARVALGDIALSDGVTFNPAADGELVVTYSNLSSVYARQTISSDFHTRVYPLAGLSNAPYAVDGQGIIYGGIYASGTQCRNGALSALAAYRIDGSQVQHYQLDLHCARLQYIQAGPGSLTALVQEVRSDNTLHTYLIQVAQGARWKSEVPTNSLISDTTTGDINLLIPDTGYGGGHTGHQAVLKILDSKTGAQLDSFSWRLPDNRAYWSGIAPVTLLGRAYVVLTSYPWSGSGVEETVLYAVDINAAPLYR